MKKQHLNSLKLNKRSISKLQQKAVIGGATIGTLCALYSILICPSDICITTAQTGEILKPSCGNCNQ